MNLYFLQKGYKISARKKKAYQWFRTVFGNLFFNELNIALLESAAFTNSGSSNLLAVVARKLVIPWAPRFKAVTFCSFQLLRTNLWWISNKKTFLLSLYY